MSKIRDFVKNYIPIYSIVCFVLALISLLFYLILRSSTSFSEAMTVGFTSVIRTALSYVFSFLPFSFAELLLILSPLLLTTVIILAVRSIRASSAAAIRLLVVIISTLTLFFSLYVFTLAPGYTRASIAGKLDIDADNPTADELFDTLMILEEQMDSLLPEIEFESNGASSTELTVAELSDIICEGYNVVCEKYPNLGITNFPQRAKPIILSQGMTYLELLGIYSYFTGESNVNVHHPDYSLPFTIAHEFAHARGISRENEANFIAFLVCINSDNSYVKYSGYMNMYEYVASALGKTDTEMLKDAYSRSDNRIIGEMRAYADFFYSNQVEILGNISDFFNDKYLKSQGTEGIVSYGLVVRLCVGYYNSQ